MVDIYEKIYEKCNSAIEVCNLARMIGDDRTPREILEDKIRKMKDGEEPEPEEFKNKSKEKLMEELTPFMKDDNEDGLVEPSVELVYTDKTKINLFNDVVISSLFTFDLGPTLVPIDCGNGMSVLKYKTKKMRIKQLEKAYKLRNKNKYYVKIFESILGKPCNTL